MHLRVAAPRLATSASILAKARSQGGPTITLKRSLARHLSTRSNAPPSPPKRLHPLAASAAAGFAAGLIFVLVRRWSSRDPGTVRLDGAPALTVVDTHGKPWFPVDAYEKDDPRNPMRIRMSTWVKSLQEHIVSTLETLEACHPAPPSLPYPTSSSPPKFLRDAWLRPEGGEGSSCVLSNGRIFEKAGVNISIVHGKLPTAAQKQMRADHASMQVLDKPRPYIATGISIVLHPRNPHVPTVHLNYRYFEVEDPDKPGEPAAWWFGGGSDLTPSYLVEDDARHFHATLKTACDKHSESYWPVFKPWCDKYFYIPHRKESRGVGGFFFDDLTTSSPLHASAPEDGKKPPTQDEVFDFVKSVSSAFLPSYVPIVLRNKDRGWTEEERRWQLLRRGRYVEFNLVYDRGTKFGLAIPGARVESILMSLPETARWEYMTPMGAEGTEEGKLMEVLRKPREWA